MVRPVNSVYCVVPRELARALNAPLRRYFRLNRSIEVVVERRRSDRRAHPRGGGDRRATLRLVKGPTLPRIFDAYTTRLTFVERVPGRRASATEDADTARAVREVQAGDPNAFGEIYMRYFDRIYGYLRVIIGDDHEAQDATQQVFTRAYEALPRYVDRGEPFRAWLFTIARNYAITEVRKRSRITVADIREVERRRDLDPEAETRALEWITDFELMVFVERLPPPQRHALILRYMFDLTNTEIAAILDRSEDDVRKLQSRAILYLRERLSAIGRRTGGRIEQHSCRRPSRPVVPTARRLALSPGA